MCISTLCALDPPYPPPPSVLQLHTTMVSADVPFESPEEIAEKLVNFEEQFKYRYTEGDEGFHIAEQRSSRWGKGEEEVV